MDIGKALGGAQSFLFGPGTDTPTYESLRKKREIAEMLAQQSIGGEYRNWGDGVGGILKALGYRMMDKKLGPQEDAERSRISDLLGGFGGGPSGPVAGAAGGFTGAGYSGDPSSLGMSTMDGAGAAVAPSAARMESITPQAQASLDALQNSWGSPLNVISGYRDPEHNAKVGGAKGSQHVHGNAFDVDVKDMPVEQRKALIEQAKSSGFKGVGVYDNSLHFDVGPERAWGPSYHGDSIPEWAQPVVAAMGGGGIPGMSGGQSQPDMGRISQLAEVMGNPYATDGQKMVAQALVERELAQQDPIDPLGMARLGLDAQRLQLDRDKFASGTREGPKFYGTAQWADRTPDDDDPRLSPYQIGTDGSVNWLDLNGAQPQPPTRNVDLGTQQAQVGPGGGVQATLTKDVAGAAAQAEVGKSAGAAAAGLGDKEVNVQAALDQIDRISNDPALDGILGNWEGRLPSRTQAQANVQAQVEGLQGKVFNAAIDSLRGLGAMTEREGDAAKEAMAALSQLQDGSAYRAELKRLGDLLKAKLEVARRKAATVDGGGVPQSAIDAGIDPDLWQYLSPEDRALWQN